MAAGEVWGPPTEALAKDWRYGGMAWWYGGMVVWWYGDLVRFGTGIEAETETETDSAIAPAVATGLL